MALYLVYFPQKPMIVLYIYRMVPYTASPRFKTELCGRQAL